MTLKSGEIATVEKDNAVIERYKYDVLGRLVREDNRAFNKTVVYAYDTFGNITSKTISAFTLSDNTSTGTVKSYGYATGGIRGRLISYNGKSLTSYTAKPYSDTGYPQVYFKHGSSDYWKLQWNGSSLKSMQLCNSVGTEKTDKIEYLYNGSGARVRKTVNGIHTDYIYVGSRLLREVKDEYSIDYVYGAEGAVGFEITRSNGVTSRYYYLKNIQGDITHIVDNNGGIVVKYEYDAWGNCKVHDPDGTENGDEDFIGNINPIRYRGYYYDVETKLYYLMSRYYDPEVGRFISPDSAEYIEPEILGGLNLYSYCYNNPVMYYDPSGHFIMSLFIISIIGYAIIGGVGAGLSAYENGANVWGIFGSAVLGAIFGVAVGAIVGLILGFSGPGMGMLFGSGGGTAAMMLSGVGALAVSVVTVGAGIAVADAGASLIGNRLFYNPHRTNKTPSNKPLHEAGEKHRKMDQGGEKADTRRIRPREYRKPRIKGKKGKGLLFFIGLLLSEWIDQINSN